MFGILNRGAIPALEQTASFTQRRHDVLASNIANASTPGYRSRDLDVNVFQSELAESIRAGTTGRSNDSGPAGSMPALGRDDIMSGPRAASEAIVYHDGSDVSLEHQVTEIAKNQHMHALAISTMRNQFALLQAAITERV